MLVYRVENRRDAGPFWDADGRLLDLLRSHVGERGHIDPRFPTPPADTFEGGLPLTVGTWKHGCGSLAQLREWFPKTIRKELLRQGFRVNVYDVPDNVRELRVGKRQVLFRKRAARLVERLDPVNLMPLAA